MRAHEITWLDLPDQSVWKPLPIRVNKALSGKQILLNILWVILLSSQGGGQWSASGGRTFLSGKVQTPIFSVESYAVSVATIQL